MYLYNSLPLSQKYTELTCIFQLRACWRPLRVMDSAPVIENGDIK